MYTLTCKLDVFKPVTLKYTFVYKHKLFVGKLDFFWHSLFRILCFNKIFIFGDARK